MSRKVTVAVGDWAGAFAVVDSCLDESLAARGFSSKSGAPLPGMAAMWFGPDDTLRKLGPRRGTEPAPGEFAAVLQGCHTVTGAGVVLDEGGWPRPPGAAVNTFELIFAVPQSLSWLWAMSEPDVRAEIEDAVMESAIRAVTYLTLNRPVVDGMEPARGFAALLSLHALARLVRAEATPPPLLHAHCHLLGVQDTAGHLRTPRHQALREDYAMRECGAYGRLVLADQLIQLGFPVEPGTGPEGRYFEVAGVPTTLWRYDAWQRAECGGPLAELLA